MKFPLCTSAAAGLALFSATARAVEAGHGNEIPSNAPVAASEDGRNAMKAFRYDAGLQCELWAAEPMVANAVAFSQDEKGRWFVAESFRQEQGVEDNRQHVGWIDRDIASQSVADRLAMMHDFYPDPAQFQQKFARFEERIRRLEDKAGGGFADQVTIFADGFRDPLDGTGAGLLARGQEVWSTNIPNLWHFRDANDDGVADGREKLLTGFGIKFALRGHDMHGLRFGPDGKLYFSIGDRALRVTTREGKELANTDSGSIMRCDPDGSNFEIFSTGMRNPQELAFDEHGNLFTCDNNSDAGDAARFTYLVEGGDCGWRMAYQYLSDRGPWNRERPWDEKLAPSVAYIIPCVQNVSAGPSGLTYNPGTALSEKYQGKFFLSDFRGGPNASVVHEIGTQPKGAFFTGTHREWVRGILTTDVEFGNDGSLYVLDWVASWMGVGKGRIYKFTDPQANKALQKETEKLIAEGMTSRAEKELAERLTHPDMRVRQAAQFELARRGTSSIPVFARVATDAQAGASLARLHAIWGLGQIAARDRSALDPLVRLLSDRELEIRAQAAKVLGDAKVPAAADRFLALLHDPENRVRFFAAMALSKLAHAPAFEPLCAMLAENNDGDPILRHGGVMGLVACGTPAQIAAKASDASPGVRRAAVVALRRAVSPLVASFLQDADAGIVLEAARAIYDVPIAAAMPQLAALTEQPTGKNPHALSRAVHARYRLGAKGDAQALASLAIDSAAPEASRKEALESLASWAHPNGKDRLMNQWRPLPDRTDADAVAAATPLAPALLRDPSVSMQTLAAKMVGALALPNVGALLRDLAGNAQAGEPARIEAIRALAAVKDDGLTQVVKNAVSDRSPRIRSEAMQALAGSGSPEAVQIIAGMVDTGTVIERQGGLQALSKIDRPESDAVLARLLDELAAKKLPTEIHLDVIEAARKRGTPDLKARVARYEGSYPPADDLAKWRFALTGGSVERGRKLFREKPETQCLRCHICETGDSPVGPDLTHIAATKDRAYLLESIVYPNKHLAQGFETVIVTMNDGNVVAGRLLSEDATALKVESADAQGKPLPVNVALAQIRQRDRAPSPMPPNLVETLSPTELRDVVEYLATRK